MMFLLGYKMPIVKNRSILSGVQVKEAMRRNVNRLPFDTSISVCIRHMIKFKSNAVLVDDFEGAPCGVVSKTDILGVYYADLPVETTLQDIMAGPPQFCYLDDNLEDVIDIMQNNGIHLFTSWDQILMKLRAHWLTRTLWDYCTVTAEPAQKACGKVKKRMMSCHSLK